MAQPTLHRCPALDFLDDSSVVPDAGVEAEVATVDLAQTDWFEVLGGDASGELRDRRDRIVWHTERAGEHVGTSAGEHAEGRLTAGDTGRDLVERAIAAIPDHDIDAAASCILSESGGVAATIGLDNFDLVGTLHESAVHDNRVACRHRRRESIDHQQDLQGIDSTAGWVPSWVLALPAGNNVHP